MILSIFPLALMNLESESCSVRSRVSKAVYSVTNQRRGGKAVWKKDEQRFLDNIARINMHCGIFF